MTHRQIIASIGSIILLAILLATALAAIRSRASSRASPSLARPAAEETAPASPAFLVESGPERVGGIDLWVITHKETQRRYIYARDDAVRRFTLVPLDRKSTSPFAP